MQKKPTGLYHFASQGYVSRFGVAQFIIQTLGLEAQLTRRKTGDYPSSAARPLNSRFDCSKIRLLLHGPIKPWQIPLETFVKQL
jgi:dTDP-4-dehydrorhamnose reductase